MNCRPISPLMHGIIDYGFTAAQFVLPPILGLNKKALAFHAAFVALAAVNVLLTN